MSETEAPRPFSGYGRVRSERIDEALLRVGRGTPGGEYLRRFWQPLMLAKELADLPLPVKLLGEELVVFRDKGFRFFFYSNEGNSREPHSTAFWQATRPGWQYRAPPDRAAWLAINKPRALRVGLRCDHLARILLFLALCSSSQRPSSSISGGM